MIFKRTVPSIRTLKRLADLDGPFPMECRHMILAAERLWFGATVINFLKLFSPHEVFESREDFVERCRQLREVVLDERQVPRKVLLEALRGTGKLTHGALARLPKRGVVSPPQLPAQPESSP